MEIHVEPTTKSKMFCGCSAEHFVVEPNTHTCPVCLGLPGALPVPNKAAIESCLKLGLALNCQINLHSKFDRKNYFYPDLPKAYQISQYDLPFCYEGQFTASKDLKVRITRVHMEEDTGKLQHVNNSSLIDFNRSGVPLLEIVTEPDLHSAEDMTTFLKELVKTIKWLGISDCDMEKGALRLEANISVKSPNDKNELPNYKVEIKNVNSFRYIEKAVKYEIERHIELLKKGQTPKQETRGFDENKDVTFSQRSKETAQDYRYFPEPDIPPINLENKYIEKLKAEIPELPLAVVSRLVNKYSIREDFLQILINDLDSLQSFEKLLSELPKEIKPNEAAKQIVNQKLDLIQTDHKKIVKAILSAQKSYSISETELEKIISQAITDNPKPVEDYKSGKQQAIGALIGAVARQTKGQADPQMVRKMLLEQLG